MDMPIQLKRMSIMAMMVAIFAAGFTAPATKAEPPRPAKEKPKPREDRYGDPLPPGALVRLGTIRLRRGYDVFSLAQRDAFLSVSPDEENTDVCVWRMSTGELLRRFQLPLRRVAAAVTADGKTLAISGLDERRGTRHIFLYDASSGKKTAELAQTNLTFALAFTADGKTIASEGDDKIVRLWDTTLGTEIRRFQATNQGFLNRLVFSPDGKLLASAGLQQRTVHLWDTATGQERRVFNAGPGLRCSVVFSPDGKTIATASYDDKIARLWDTATGQEIRHFSGEMGIASLAFSPDGKLLAGGCRPKPGEIHTTSPIHLWDASSGKEVHRLPGHVFTVTSLAFSSDGKRLISGSSSAVTRVWDLAAGKELTPFAEHESWIMSVAFSPGGRMLASGSLDGTIRLWQAATGQPIRALEGGVQPQVRHVVFSPDGQTLFSDRSDGSLRVWNATTGRQKRRIQVSEGVYSHTFDYSPDGRTLAVWHKDGSIRLLDADTGAERRQLAAGGSGEHLCFSPDGRTLAALRRLSGRGGILQLWDSGSGMRRHKLTVPASGPIVFSSAGRSLMYAGGDNSLPAGATQRTLHCWDVITGTDRPFEIPQHARIFALAVSPNGRMLAWGDTAGTVTLWDLDAQQVRRRLKGQHSYVCSLAFSPNGKTLASGNADTTVLMWDATGRPAEGRVGPFSAEQLQTFWSDLAGKDAAKAFDAIGLLTASPQQAVPLMKSKLRPAPEPVERRQIVRLIAELDSDEFAVRENAKEQLRQLGEGAEPGLREALKSKPPLETRKRIEELMEGIIALSASPDRLRELRAVETLEHIGTAEARKVLRTLAGGGPHARLTREAKASLARLDKRLPPNP